jgi:hypothetical protein
VWKEYAVGFRELQRRHRNTLAWSLAGMVGVQLALAIGIEHCWPAIRDPDFHEIEAIIRSRTAAARGRPLVVALGSSRTQMALAPARLNRSSAVSDPIVINAAVAGGGPMMHQVILRRILAMGVRPQLVFIEAMPMSLSARAGAPVEERQRDQGRYTVEEIALLWQYYAEHHRLCYPWVVARALPALRYRGELCEALQIDFASARVRAGEPTRDRFGWLACPKDYSDAEIAARTCENLQTYSPALTQPTLAPGAVHALYDVVQLCLDSRIAVALIVPPEGSAFRSYAPAVEERQMHAVRVLARELDVPLIDARTWVEDSGFWDGHHATPQGAAQYTERFAHEALAPQLARTQPLLHAER